MKQLQEKWVKLQNLSGALFLFDIEKKRFMLNANTCRFFEIDGPMAALIANINLGADISTAKQDYQDKFPEQNIEETLNELFTLYSQGFITGEDHFMEKPPKTPKATTSLCLIMATDCNLRCRYCFAEGGSYKHSRQLMSAKVAENAVDFLMKKSGWLRNLELSFFGGEPCLNFNVIKRTVEYAEKAAQSHQKKVNFNITTNATLLNEENMDFFLAHDFGFIVSIDGPKEVNDKFRVFPSGSGSHDVVVSRLKELLSKYPQLKDKVTIRATFTEQTTQITATLDYLKGLGFKNISIEPVISKNQNCQISQKAVAEVMDEYDKAAKYYVESIKRGEAYQFFHMHQMFFQVAEGQRRFTQCGAGAGYLAVDPEGEVYPCHRLVGDKRYLMGNVSDSTLNPELTRVFAQASIVEKAECKGCWARYVCGGGCHATAILFNDQILKPHSVECTLMQHRIKLGAWIYSQIKNPNSSY